MVSFVAHRLDVKALYEEDRLTIVDLTKLSYTSVHRKILLRQYVSLQFQMLLGMCDAIASCRNGLGLRQCKAIDFAEDAFVAKTKFNIAAAEPSITSPAVPEIIVLDRPQTLRPSIDDVVLHKSIKYCRAVPLQHLCIIN
ncbi:hypothetical protein HELRODRAFT_178555 [Helobdella robusta]|uniref:Uncharacterized protein n=1 Tax=Helobdella robusta TaxID=6412 RepID=T1FDD3_HELRO|nr:hypothetical protein HELRODRAFT_178555 [Helobdella robusta]ESN97104.1 hypothetical protein HELRODRAFT_178555 [Helobdella robusta]